MLDFAVTRGATPDDGIAVALSHHAFEDVEFVLTFTGDAELAGFAVLPRRDRPDGVGEQLDWRREEKGVVGPARFPAGSPTITRRLLRDVPLGALEDYGRRMIRHQAGKNKMLDAFAVMAIGFRERAGEDVTDARSRLRAWQEMPLRPGARGTPDAYYADLAAAYVELCEGGSNNPNVELGNTLHLSSQTITNQVGEARRRGMLTRAGPGRAGGELTPKAIALLSARSA